MQPQQQDEFSGLLAEIDRLPAEWALVAVGANKGPHYEQWESTVLKAIDFRRAQKEGFLERAKLKGKSIRVDSIKAVGVMCGVPSGGLLFFDHDGASCDGLIQQITGLSLQESLPKTVAVTSGRSGRYQLVYRVPAIYWEGIATKKVKTGTLGDDDKPEQIEFRWTGCQSVVAGHHPMTGGYVWKYHPADVEVAAAPQWMISQMFKESQAVLTPRADVSDREWALSYLQAIPPADDYDTWISVGMALHSVDPNLSDEWDSWSSQAQNYKPGACDKKWRSFKKSGAGIGTLGYLAKQNGWQCPEAFKKHTQPNERAPRSGLDAVGRVSTLKDSIARFKAISDPFEQALAENAIAEEFGVRGARLKDLVATLPGGSLPVFTMPDIVTDIFAEIEDRIQNPGLIGISSGFHDLDAMTYGWQQGDLIITAARPSMGKTSFAMSCAMTAAEKGKKVLVFSIETDKKQLGYRMLSTAASIDSGKFKTGRLTNEDLEKVVSVMPYLGELPISIVDAGIESVGDIIEQTKNQEGVDLVIIDYLQLLSAEGDNRNLEISKITRNLKALARDLSIPINALSQLSRNLETRSDKRPTNADLRDSGAIEQDADVILMLYRDEYYNADSVDRGIAEVIVTKNRNGPTGKVKLLFEPQYTRFRGLRSGA